MPRSREGSRVHKELVSQTLKRLKDEKFKVIGLLQRLPNGKRVDILATKRRKVYAVECQLRMVPKALQERIENVLPHADRLIFSVPQEEAHKYKTQELKNVEVWAFNIPVPSRAVRAIIDGEQMRKISRVLGFRELRGKVRRLEEAVMKLQKQMAEWGIPLPFYDPYKLCKDSVDRQIIDILWSSTGLTTTQIASMLEDHDRWFVLRRMQAIERRGLKDKDLNPEDSTELKSIFERKGREWALNRDVLL